MTDNNDNIIELHAKGNDYIKQRTDLLSIQESKKMHNNIIKGLEDVTSKIKQDGSIDGIVMLTFQNDGLMKDICIGEIGANNLYVSLDMMKADVLDVIRKEDNKEGADDND